MVIGDRWRGKEIVQVEEGFIFRAYSERAAEEWRLSGKGDYPMHSSGIKSSRKTLNEMD